VIPRTEFVEQIKHTGFVRNSKKVRGEEVYVSGAVWICPGCRRFNYLGQTWFLRRKRLVVLLWLGACFSRVGGDVLDEISKSIGRQVKDMVASIKCLARHALYSNCANIRTDVSLFRIKMKLTL
jgi:hypothetical protein